jgi:hypothetical protein
MPGSDVRRNALAKRYPRRASTTGSAFAWRGGDSCVGWRSEWLESWWSSLSAGRRSPSRARLAPDIDQYLVPHRRPRLASHFDGDGLLDQVRSNSSPPEAGPDCPGVGETHAGLAVTFQLANGSDLGMPVADSCVGARCGSLVVSDFDSDGRNEVGVVIEQTGSAVSYVFLTFDQGRVMALRTRSQHVPARFLVGTIVKGTYAITCTRREPRSPLTRTMIATAIANPPGSWLVHEETLQLRGINFAQVNFHRYTVGSDAQGNPMLPGEACWTP